MSTRHRFQRGDELEPKREVGWGCQIRKQLCIFDPKSQLLTSAVASHADLVAMGRKQRSVTGSFAPRNCIISMC